MAIVQDAPGREHAPDGRLAAARRHLARTAPERTKPFILLFVARLVERNVDSLKVVPPRLGQQNDRLGGLELREKQSLLTAVPTPVLQQLEGRAGATRPAVLAPLLDALANEIDEREFDALSRGRALFRRAVGTRRAIEVMRGPAPRLRARLGTFLEQPVQMGFTKRRADARLRNLEVGRSGRRWCSAR